MKTILYENEHFALVLLGEEEAAKQSANYGVLNKQYGTIDFYSNAEVSARFQAEAFNEQKIYNIEKEKDEVIEQSTNVERLH